MQINCQKCGIAFHVKPSKVSSRKYCSRACSDKKLTRPCAVCSAEVTRVQSQMLNVVYCGTACASIGKAERFRQMNTQLNPNRMTVPTKAKLRAAGLKRGDKKHYEFTSRELTHRIVAAEKLGRPLLKGEVVHHNDEDKRNNDPNNLTVFASQADHARYHKLNDKKVK